ncbi:MAG TPA: hypothetical protein PKC30_09345 [Saprospiraceae bacterium]|nr:hypothetical protein [Saprospiraceae bacterium]
MKTSWITASLVNFFIASILGLLLRYAFVGSLHPLEYRNILHAHSHLSLLGWLFMILFTMMVHRFVPKEKANHAIYSRLFWSNQLILLVMTLSFILYGYRMVSIVISSLHFVVAYMMIYRLIKDSNQKHTFSGKLFLTSLFWLAFSTLGVWCIGPAMVYFGRNSEFYFWCIQFFLHFQFNGWFIFGVLSIFFNEWEKSGIPYSKSLTNLFYWLLVVSCFLTYTLAVTWSSPEEILFTINGTGVVLQLIALIVFLQILIKGKEGLKVNFRLYSSGFIILALISFIVKVAAQSILVIPWIAVVSYTIRLFVIGFIHLTLLGIATCFIFDYFIRHHVIYTQFLYVKMALWIFSIAYVGSELLLFTQGLFLWIERGFIPGYYHIILYLSVLFPVALGILILHRINVIKGTTIAK